MKKFALVTVNYNSGKDLQNLHDSLLKMEYDKLIFDWLIIDNCGKNEEDREAVKKLCIENNYIYIQSDKNGGFANGSNLGIKSAIENMYDYIGLINPDCVFTQKSFFVNLENAFENKDKKIDIITPLITYYPETKTIYSAGGSANNFFMLTKMFGKGETDFSKYNREIESDFATGCALFAKRKVFEQVGLIPEEYFLYFEEADWCQKAVRNGFKMFYIPTAQISHGVSTSIGYLSKIYVFHMIRNYPIFAKKYISWYNLPIFYIFYIFVWCGGYCYILIKNKKPELIKYVFKGFLNLKL
jgi:GT2 family glycosyltransferase